MRKLLVLAVLVLLSALSVRAQSVVTPGNPILNSAGVPVGTCSSFNIDVITSTGALYTCAAGTWTLVGGAGAVLSVFGRTGAVVAVSGDYTLDQVGNPAASKTFSLTSFNLGISAPGVFTSAAQNDQFLVTLTGGGTCSPLSILNGGGSTTKLTDVIAGCVNTPTSGNTNGFSNALAGYAQVNDTGTEGQFGFVGATGLYTNCQAVVNNAHCWGANVSAADGTSTTGNVIFGNEVDLQINNNTTSGSGFLMSLRGNGQPTADNYPTVDIQVPTGTGKWTSGFKCESGSMASGSTDGFACVSLGQRATGNAQDSQFIYLHANNVTTPIKASLGLAQDNFMAIGSGVNSMIVDNSPGTEEGFGIGVKTTLGLSPNTLVKIDTANADTFILCTTADTLCNGFVNGTSSVYCAVGTSNFCPVITVPGSRAQGILGTGTCGIGNWVIVDTTTNGDVKCATTQPVAWQGFALATNSTVGTAFDVLVSPGTTATTGYLTSLYTNATTTFSSVTGLSFPVAANTNYKVACDLDYQVSASTLDIKIQWTGPASPTFLVYDLNTAVTGSTLSASVNPATATTTGAFSTALTEAGTPTATTNFPLRTTMTLINGANAGTIQLQAAATAAGTVSILPGSCSIQR